MARASGRVEAADAADRQRVRHLVAISEADPLAPFALRPEKSYVFSADGDAAVGYSVRLGTAVASGDPIGAPDAWAAAIDAFMLMARRRRLRVAVLGAGERAHDIWATYHLGGVAVGRDVVLQRENFSVGGRRYRNLRQAIQRSRNAGVVVDISREGDLAQLDVADLRALMHDTKRRDSRGFSMILGRLFDGTEPDAVVAVARDATGRIIGAHRYLWAGKQDLSLDLPIRAKGAADPGVSRPTGGPETPEPGQLAVCGISAFSGMTPSRPDW
jgi:lysylphosphatidylglycerol synthetase-like protein (DUF2156 family)